MPKLHLAYLVEDVEYPIPEELQASKEVGSSFSLSFFMCQYKQKVTVKILCFLPENFQELPHSSRVKRQQSSFPAVNQAEAGEEDEQLETEDAETFATASPTPRRNAALSAAILRVLEVAAVVVKP